MVTDELSVIILSGGLSRRMGQDKALLQLNGESLLNHAVNFASQLIGSNTLGTRLFISRNQPGYIQDQVKDAGPMAGIAAALAHCQSAYALVIPVDMPLLTPAVVTPLLQLTTQREAGYFRQWPLPVLMRCDAELSTELHNRLHSQSPNRSLAQLWHDLGYQQLSPPDSACFVNCNDPQSFSKVQNQWLSQGDLNDNMC